MRKRAKKKKRICFVVQYYGWNAVNFFMTKGLKHYIISHLFVQSFKANDEKEIIYSIYEILSSRYNSKQEIQGTASLTACCWIVK